MRAAFVCSALCLLLFPDFGATQVESLLSEAEGWDSKLDAEAFTLFFQGTPAPGTSQAVGLAPGPSLPVLPAGLSPLVSLVGRIVAAEAQCPAAGGSAAVYIALDGLPQNFSNANLACKFPQWQDVRDFNLTGGEVQPFC